MIDLQLPQYHWGERVRAAVDLVNDGSHPGVAKDAVLATVGTEGEIVNVGHHVDANIPIYLVEFTGNVVIGCLEDELVRI